MNGALAILLAASAHAALAASDHIGQVTFMGVPVPGATVTASQGDTHVATLTNAQGAYRFAGLADGTWAVRIEMLGFAPATRDVVVAPEAPPVAWELTILPFEEIVRNLPPPPEEKRYSPENPQGRAPATNASAGSSARSPAPQTPTPPAGSGFQRAGVTTPPRAAAAVSAPVADEPTGDAAAGAADGFLINGSVNNSAASPFALPPAFGNNRRRPGALYNFGLAVIGDTSIWDSRQYSFSSERPPKDDYYDLQFSGTFGGPLRFPRLMRNGPNLFIGYQRSSDHLVSTGSGVMPTGLERNGDFSQTRDASGRPVRIVDPATGMPFSGNRIPRERISPQAAALLGYYPDPNLEGDERFNYQASLLANTSQDSVQSRITQPVTRGAVFGNFAYQRTRIDSRTLFGFDDLAENSGLDASINWTRRISQLFSMRLRYQYTRLTNSMTPYFAGRTNVSGVAGITGNNQDPENWGPPSLVFSTVEGLTDALHRSTENQANIAGAEAYVSRGRHNMTVGGEIRHTNVDILSQQNPRGSFTFTGAETGYDFADFLLGIPSASSIAFGNADKYFRANSYAAYFTDDWRLGPGITFNLGVRWEYEGTITEKYGRLVNLDVTTGFAAASPVVATDPVGTLTGTEYPAALMKPDWRGLQPRLALAWRPIAGSSLVVRAGYGIYRNTSVYQAIATQLAQQPPLSNTFNAENTTENPLTLANGFVAPPSSTLNTFAVDPAFRIGYAHNWQVSMQRDLPASLTMIATYLGSKGSLLMQQFLPNTYPAGAVNPCPACPAGFIYLTSTGDSLRNAGQMLLRRRLRNGLTASVQYTFAKATDDATSFNGVNLGAIAQDWLDLDAEYGPSSFDQRHQVSALFQYTTGVGVAGGTLLDGWRGTLFKGWTVITQLNTGSGLPLSPVYLASIPGTGLVGVRPNATGTSIDDAPSGYYANPAAFAPPASGQWGTAGRNSIRGPAQFSLNAGVGRNFAMGSRLNLEWRLDATNVLNRVTFASITPIVGNPQFGLPNVANPMRKIQMTARLRY